MKVLMNDALLLTNWRFCSATNNYCFEVLNDRILLQEEIMLLKA